MRTLKRITMALAVVMWFVSVLISYRLGREGDITSGTGSIAAVKTATAGTYEFAFTAATEEEGNNPADSALLVHHARALRQSPCLVAAAGPEVVGPDKHLYVFADRLDMSGVIVIATWASHGREMMAYDRREFRLPLPPDGQVAFFDVNDDGAPDVVLGLVHPSYHSVMAVDLQQPPGQQVIMWTARLESCGKPVAVYFVDTDGAPPQEVVVKVSGTRYAGTMLYPGNAEWLYLIYTHGESKWFLREVLDHMPGR